MARRRVSEAERARRAAEGVAAAGERLPRELAWEMTVFFTLFQKDSPNRHLGEAYSNWVPRRDRARAKWFADRGISTQHLAADPRYTEALEGVKALTVEEWIQWHGEGKLSDI